MARGTPTDRCVMGKAHFLNNIVMCIHIDLIYCIHIFLLCGLSKTDKNMISLLFANTFFSRSFLLLNYDTDFVLFNIMC